MKFLICLVALVGFAVAESIPFNLCDQGSVTIGSVDVSPFPIVAGSNVTINAVGNLGVDVTSATYELVVKVLGIPLIDEKGDLCAMSEKFTCPHTAGDVNLEEIIEVPSIAPKGKYTIQLKGKDQDSKTLFCAEANIQIGAAVSSLVKDSEFEFFIDQYNKAYEPEEYSIRNAIFRQNKELIDTHNADADVHGWTMAMNEFGDLSGAEFKQMYTGYNKPRPSFEGVPRETVKLAGLFNVPTSIDWTTKGAVTPVKNQGQCGSCWAFSTTGSVEGAHQLSTGNLVSLSEQELVDCSTAEGNQGCNGGLMDDAFQYIIKDGICTEAAYPYKGVDGTCQTTCTSAASISSFKDVTESEDDLVAAIALAPVSVAIEADQLAFQFYSKGVMAGRCGTNLDHGVLAVGYGTDSASGKDFYKVKNSWGASWGMSGYILLARGSTYNGAAGQCGIQSSASYPIV